MTYRSFGPEEVDAFELGLKTELFNRNVRLNLAAYTMDRTGSQIDFVFTPKNAANIGFDYETPMKKS